MQYPGVSYYNGETPGEFRRPNSGYNGASGPNRPGVVGINWNGSAGLSGSYTPYGNPSFPVHYRELAYDLTTQRVALARYDSRPRPTAPPLQAIPAYALPNVALMEGNYKAQYPARDKTTVYVKVK